MARPIPIVHVITGLVTGGAETMLARLLGALPRDEFPATVVSLTRGGPVAERIRALGVDVQTLEMRGPVSVWRGARQLRRILRAVRPAVVQGWMHHANLAALVASAGLVPRRALLWNIRMTVYDMALERPATRLAIRAGALVSGRPGRIIYNSEVARRQHEAAGYSARGGVVIPNGFETAVFRPDPESRAAIRRELGVPSGRLLVGLVGRYHVMKGHADLLAAQGRLLAQGVDVDVVCAGRDVTPGTPALAELIGEHGLAGRVHLLGERRDTHRLFAALDVGCCASTSGEGFPNAVGEAMACGVPCVVTDVGDAAMLVGATGVVVPRHDRVALAAGLAQLLGMPAEARAALGVRARARIEERFAMAHVAGMYASVYRQAAAR